MSSTSKSSTKIHNTTCKTKVTEDVKQLYKVIKKHSGAVGGYGHNGPVYGEVTMVSFQKIVDYLAEHLNFGSHSKFVDIGSGLGKPNLHVAVSPGVEYSFGVEIERLRWQLGMHNLRYCLQDNSLKKVMERKGHANVYFANNDVTDIAHFQPFTHIYMFDIGFPPAALVAIANAFNVSRTVQALVSFQRPRHIIDTYGFAVECVGKVQTRMCGSSEGHTAYIYKSTLNAMAAPTEDESKASKENEEPVGPTPRLPPRSRKRRRAQQLQLDSFATITSGKKRAKASSASKPKVLFPDKNTPSGMSKRIAPAVGETDSIMQIGFDMLRPGTDAGDGQLVLSEDYAEYVAGSGGLLTDTPQRTRRRTPARRILSF